MENGEKKEIARNLLLLFPLINKKLFPPSKTRQDNDLSVTHFFILKSLEDFGDLTLTDIGKKLSIQKSNLTPLVQKLEEAELVSRKSSTSDRRVNYLSLTTAGDEFLHRHSLLLEEEVQQRLTALQDEELQQLEESVLQLQYILAKIDKER